MADLAQLRDALIGELGKARQWRVHGTNTLGDPLNEREMVEGVAVVEVAAVNAAIEKILDDALDRAELAEHIAGTERKRAAGLQEAVTRAVAQEQVDHKGETSDAEAAE